LVQSLGGRGLEAVRSIKRGRTAMKPLTAECWSRNWNELGRGGGGHSAGKTRGKNWVWVCGRKVEGVSGGNSCYLYQQKNAKNGVQGGGFQNGR